eukprot:scaffold80879_cov58-Phaeocystis_antarctica.AAC.4
MSSPLRPKLRKNVADFNSSSSTDFSSSCRLDLEITVAWTSSCSLDCRSAPTDFRTQTSSCSLDRSFTLCGRV